MDWDDLCHGFAICFMDWDDLSWIERPVMDWDLSWIGMILSWIGMTCIDWDDLCHGMGRPVS
jgi:hypothetical protein